MTVTCGYIFPLLCSPSLGLAYSPNEVWKWDFFTSSCENWLPILCVLQCQQRPPPSHFAGSLSPVICWRIWETMVENASCVSANDLVMSISFLLLEVRCIDVHVCSIVWYVMLQCCVHVGRRLQFTSLLFLLVKNWQDFFIPNSSWQWPPAQMMSQSSRCSSMLNTYVSIHVSAIW